MTQKLNPSNSGMKKIKFLYSYGGKIVVRRNDGKLRYAGGYTRILSVDRTITYSELMVKFGESCGCSMDLKCKLPTEDFDLLVAIKSDEELRCLVEEYEKASPETKIRAVLFPVGSAKKVSPPSSPMSCSNFPSAARPPQKTSPSPSAAVYRAVQWPEANIRAVHFPIRSAKKASPPSSPMSSDFPSYARPAQKTSHRPSAASPPCAAVQWPEANIRAVPFPIRSAKKASPPSSPISCFDFPSAAVYRALPAVQPCSFPAVLNPVLAGNCLQARKPMHFYHVPRRNFCQ